MRLDLIYKFNFFALLADQVRDFFVSNDMIFSLMRQNGPESHLLNAIEAFLEMLLDVVWLL